MIELRDLRKSFGGSPVLDGFDLAVPRGRSLALLGGSGSGKSVTLKCLLGLERPDAGRILIDGAEMTRRRRAELLSRTGVLFQGAALFDSLPVWENVAFRLLRGRARMSRREARAVALEKLARVGLDAETADRLPGELSGGMQKRAGLARAIAADPRLLCFDEPTTGLDPILAGVINRLIRDIVIETGATAITITHDIASVRAIADDVAMLKDGRIHWTGTVTEMDATPDAYVQAFIHGGAPVAGAG